MSNRLLDPHVYLPAKIVWPIDEVTAVSQTECTLNVRSNLGWVHRTPFASSDEARRELLDVGAQVDRLEAETQRGGRGSFLRFSTGARARFEAMDFSSVALDGDRVSIKDRDGDPMIVVELADQPAAQAEMTSITRQLSAWLGHPVASA